MTASETTAKWWEENVRQAGDRLEAYFSQEIEQPSYSDSFHVAQNTFLMSASLVLLDPSAGENEGEHQQLWGNILRVQGLARAIYEEQFVGEDQIIKAKYVLAHFEPIGDMAAHALLSCRFALSTFMTINSTIVIPEQFNRPGPEAWCLAAHAYAHIAEISTEDYEGLPRESYWVRVDEEFAGLSRAHQVNAVLSQMGGSPMSPN